MIFKGKIKHTVEITYEFSIEADSLEEAKELMEDDPFEYAGDEINSDGLGVKIIFDKEKSK